MSNPRKIAQRRKGHLQAMSAAARREQQRLIQKLKDAERALEDKAHELRLARQDAHQAREEIKVADRARWLADRALLNQEPPIVVGPAREFPRAHLMTPELVAYRQEVSDRYAAQVHPQSFHAEVLRLHENAARELARDLIKRGAVQMSTHRDQSTFSNVMEYRLYVLMDPVDPREVVQMSPNRLLGLLDT